MAHFIEITDIKVDGITNAEIEKSGWQEDQIIAKRLATRKIGQTPQLGHEH